jgi:hypothetical protein
MNHKSFSVQAEPSTHPSEFHAVAAIAATKRTKAEAKSRLTSAPLLALYEELAVDNRVTLSITQIAAKVGVCKDTIEGLNHQLVKQGVIERDSGRPGRTGSILLLKPTQPLDGAVGPVPFAECPVALAPLPEPHPTAAPVSLRETAPFRAVAVQTYDGQLSYAVNGSVPRMAWLPPLAARLSVVGRTLWVVIKAICPVFGVKVPAV